MRSSRTIAGSRKTESCASFFRFYFGVFGEGTTRIHTVRGGFLLLLLLRLLWMQWTLERTRDTTINFYLATHRDTTVFNVQLNVTVAPLRYIKPFSLCTD